MPSSPRVDRFLRPLVCGLAALALAPAAAAGAQITLAGWDAAEQSQVVKAGLMPAAPGGSWGQALTRAGATAALGALAAMESAGELPALSGQPATAAVAAAQSVVTVAGFDALLVHQLGLADVAAHVQRATAAAGLRPPPYYGSEVVARYLGLRYNHPAGTDQLELFPSDPITRAEAAWSFAQVLDAGVWSVGAARTALMAYALPALNGAQKTALRIAVSRIGYPYVWGGTTDDTRDGLAHGGFDCSGFVWRVFKVSGLPWGRQIHGRTAAQMAGEIPRSRRLRVGQLQPGDVLFFGRATFTSAATEADIIHAGIYLGDGWVIHSSSQGVYVLPLQGSWLGSEFAWARRLLPAAGPASGTGLVSAPSPAPVPPPNGGVGLP
jgi:cell wall-associated NlpC family hydrolase